MGKSGWMDGAKVRLPSGRWLHEITDYADATGDERAYMVARHMFANAEGERFYGNITDALDALWGVGKVDVNGIPAALHRNGFVASWTGGKRNSGRFYWQVPNVFPAWDSGSSITVEDDGSMPEAGPVKVRSVRSKRGAGHWSRQQQTLMRAIDTDPARHPREYAERTGMNNKLLSSVAGTLEKYGYIERRGKGLASRYFPTAKPFPYRATTRTKAPVEPKPEPTPEPEVKSAWRPNRAETVDAIERDTGGTVVYDKTGHMLVIKDGRVFRPVQGWTLQEVEV